MDNTDVIGRAEFPTLTELKEKNIEGSEALTADLEQLAMEYALLPKNRRQRRSNLTGHSKHSRFIWGKKQNGNWLRDKDGDGVLVKFHFTKVRPWVRTAENRKRTKIAKTSKVKNRGK